MIPFEKALEIVMNSVTKTGSEIIPFAESFKRILAENVISDIDIPPFDKASMDGYACRREEMFNELEIIETIAAGQKPSRALGRNQCSRIMTGAPLPGGADCVIIVEETEVLPSGRLKFKGTITKDNISSGGEDFRKGDILLLSGKKIKPQDIAILAVTGKVTVPVSKKPSVGIISSGDELVEPQFVPGESKIRNSNAWQLLAQSERAGAHGKYYGIAGDNEKETLHIVSRAIEENNVVIITGGVSMGDFDFIPRVLVRAGVRLLFDRVAVKPGKPTTFGLHQKAAVFGLPGNPVSSFMMFELLTRPFLSAMMGHNWKPRIAFLPLEEDLVRDTAGSMALIPVKLSRGNCLVPVEYHGSAHIASLSEADGIITVPVGVKRLERGTLQEIRYL